MVKDDLQPPVSEAATRVSASHMATCEYMTSVSSTEEEEERRRRKFICQKGWLPERASAHQRWLPYTQ